MKTLKTITDQAADDLKTALEENEKDILDAISEAMTSASENETPMKFKLSFGMTLDLQKNEVTNALTYGIRRKVEATHEIEDPDQIRLKLSGAGKN